jgi:hypothetical protein
MLNDLCLINTQEHSGKKSISRILKKNIPKTHRFLYWFSKPPTVIAETTDNTTENHTPVSQTFT